MKRLAFAFTLCVAMTALARAAEAPKSHPDSADWPALFKADLSTKGKIGLQGKHAGAPIYFRNLKIKELK